MREHISGLASGVPMETGSHCILGNYGNQQRQTENRPIVIIFNGVRDASISTRNPSAICQEDAIQVGPNNENKYLKAYIYDLYYPYCFTTVEHLSWFLK